MSRLTVRLFGKFRVLGQGRELSGLDASKVQELFSYLLVHRDRPHPRETLAGLLWEASSTAQSKKYLRQALWQLQSALNTRPEEPSSIVLDIEPDWVGLNPEADLRLDVAEFEKAFSLAKGIAGQDLEAQTAKSLEAAVGLYRGDLLEGWYQDWCLYHRERLQNMCLALLAKLMAYCEAHERYEAGIIFGTRILQHDRAHERAHRRLMRLHWMAGDRTAALRQYTRCEAALQEELGVQPGQPTEALHRQIQVDEIEAPPLARWEAPPVSMEVGSPLLPVLGHLQGLRSTLTGLQRQVQRDIRTIERALSGQR